MITTAKDLQEKNVYLYNVIKIMFDIIGEPIDTFDFEGDWFCRRTWTMEQRNDFVYKASDMLKDKRAFRSLCAIFISNTAKNRVRLAEEISNQWGWKLECV